MTQIALMAPAPTAVLPQVATGQASAVVAPEEFAMALDQAIGAVLAGADITQVFQIGNGSEKANAVAGSWRAVALENLAAGTIPQDVLDAVRIKISPVGVKGGQEHEETSGESESQVTVAALLEYLASLMAPAAAPQQASPIVVTSGDAAQDAQAAVEPAGAFGAAVGIETAAALPETTAPDAPVATPEETVAGQEATPVQAAQYEPVVDGRTVAVETAPVAVKADGSEASAETKAAQSEVTVVTREMPRVPEAFAAEQPAQKDDSGRAVIPAAAATVNADAVTVEASQEPLITADARATTSARRQDKPADVGRSTSIDDVQTAPGRQQDTAETSAVAAQAPAEPQVAGQVQSAGPASQTKNETEKVDGGQHVQGDGGLKSPATHAAKPEPAIGANQERFIARIASAVSEAERSGRSVVRLRLYPPDLGTVRIEVSSVRGSVSARIETSTQTTQGMLQSNLATLRADLREAGVDMRDMRVEFRDPSLAFGAEDRSARRGGQDEARQPRRQNAERETDAVEATGALTQEAGAVGLNLYI